MKIPDPIIGFLNYKSVSYPFDYDNGILSIYPPDIKTWNKERASAWHEWSELFKKEKSAHWIGHLNLYGTLHTRQKIMFCVSEEDSNINGFKSFEVNYFAVFPEELNLNVIQGFQIEGDEIDYFFPPSQTFRSDVSFGDNGDDMLEMTVCGIKEVCEKFGSFSFNNSTGYIKIYATPTLRFHSPTPFIARSQFRVEFNKGHKLAEIMDCIADVRKLFYFLCYRSNIHFTSYTFFSFKGKETGRHYGEIVFPNRIVLPETSNDCSKRIIGSQYLRTRLATLLKEVSNSTIYLEHLCESIEATHSYPVSRYILIFAAFEREFRNIYGLNHGRNEQYIDALSLAQAVISERKNSETGRTKKYLGDIERSISKLDISLSQKIKYALSDCHESMEGFIRHYYTEDTPSSIENLADRLNVLRNDLAHANLDMEIEPLHLTDFLILQLLLYAMRMKNIGILSQDVKKAIVDLFGLPRILKDDVAD